MQFDFLSHVFGTVALFYLGSRATITSWLWSRYPRWLASFMDCAACSGFWYGLILALTVGRWEHISYFGHYDGVTPLLVALGAMVWTPIVGGLMQWGFEHLGSAVDPSPPTPVIVGAEEHEQA